MPQSGGFVPIWKCGHCGHEWVPRKSVPPAVCPNPKCHKLRP